MTLYRRLLGFSTRSEFRKGVVTMVGGSTIAQAIGVAASPVLTRLYSPADFGAYSAVLAVLSLLVITSTLSYQNAIVLPDDDVVAANVLGVCVAAALCFCMATGILLLVAERQLLELLGAASLGGTALLLVLGQMLGALMGSLAMWALRAKAFAVIARNSLTRSGALIVAQVALGIAGLGATGLLIGAVAGSLAGSVGLARAAWHRDASAFRRVSPAGVRHAARRYRRFAIFSTPASFLNTLGLQLPVLLLVAMFGTEVAGQYALADRAVGLPVTLLAGAVANVFYAQAAPLAREDSAALRNLFVRTTRSLAVFTVVPTLLAMVLAPLLFDIVFGADWVQAGVFAAVMAPWYGVVLVTNPTGATLGVLERQDLHLVRELLRLGFIGAVPVIAYLVGLPPIGVVASVSLAGCATYLAYGWLSWRAIVTRRPPLPESGSPPAASL